MKKFYFLALAIVFFMAVQTDSQAQNLEALELGIRLNIDDSSPFDAAFDAVYNVSNANRFHANLGIGDGGLGADLIYDWVFTFNGDGRLILYPGVGASLYFLSDDVVLGVTGELGLEYRFDIPLSLGIDYRPTFTILPDTDLGTNSVGLNLRWRF